MNQTQSIKQFGNNLLVFLPMLYFAWVRCTLHVRLLLVISLAAFAVADYLYEWGRTKNWRCIPYTGILAGILFALTLPQEMTYDFPVLAAAIWVGIRYILSCDEVFLSVLFTRTLLQMGIPEAFYSSKFLPTDRFYYHMKLSIPQLLLGNAGGYIGELCTLSILIGFGFLVLNKKIDWAVSAAALVGGFVLFLFTGNGLFDVNNALTGISIGSFCFLVFICMSVFQTTIGPWPVWLRLLFGLLAGGGFAWGMTQNLLSYGVFLLCWVVVNTTLFIVNMSKETSLS